MTIFVILKGLCYLKSTMIHTHSNVECSINTLINEAFWNHFITHLNKSYASKNDLGSKHKFSLKARRKISITVLQLKFSNTVKSLYSGHHRDREIVSTREGCPLEGGCPLERFNYSVNTCKILQLQNKHGVSSFRGGGGNVALTEDARITRGSTSHQTGISQRIY